MSENLPPGISEWDTDHSLGRFKTTPYEDDDRLLDEEPFDADDDSGDIQNVDEDELKTLTQDE